MYIYDAMNSVREILQSDTAVAETRSRSSTLSTGVNRLQKWMLPHDSRLCYLKTKYYKSRRLLYLEMDHVHRGRFDPS